MVANNLDNNNSEKTFTLEVPGELHKTWKLLAGMLDMSMKTFALEAIREKIQRETQNKLQPQIDKI